MDRNLYIENSLWFLPARFCLKKIGPIEVTLIKIIIKINKGENKVKRNKDPKISIERLQKSK